MAEGPAVRAGIDSQPDPLPASRRRRRRRGARMPDGVKYARLSSSTALTFGLLLAAALILLHSSPKLSSNDEQIAAFYSGSSTVWVTVGTNIVPFAGIAFLWHMNTTRLLIRSRTPAPSAIPDGLQLLSGVLFVALLFAGTAAAGSVALVKDLTDAPLPSPESVRSLLGVGYGMVFVYSVRGAGMYTLTTTTLLRAAGIVPTWLAVVGYLLAAFLLVSTTSNPAVMLLLPAWAVLVGLVILIRAGRNAAPAVPQEELP
jgi:hypothetical protein